MKRFLYEHANLAAALLCIVLFLPLTAGIIITVAGGEEDAYQFAFVIGLVLSGVGALLALHPFKPVLDTLDKLSALRHGREFFEIGECISCEEAAARIAANAQKKHFQTIDVIDEDPYAPIATYQKKKVCWMKDPDTLEEYSHTSHNYLLYRVEVLDQKAWEKIAEDASRRMRNVRAENQKGKKPILTVASLCVLAEQIEPQILTHACELQKFTVSEVHVCLAVPAKDRWYAFAQPRTGDASLFSGSTCSRRTLAKLTFGGRFPYRGNERFTKAYWDALDEAIDTDLVFKKNLAQRKKAEEEGDEEALRFAEMREGEIRRYTDEYNDELYLVYHKYHVTASLFMPQEVEELREKMEEVEEIPNESIRDMIDDAESGESEYQRIPIPADYRGTIVIDTPTAALEPRLKFFGKKDVYAICVLLRDYLQAQGFARVLFWDSAGDEEPKEL
ncbi:MAG: hypothetical protein IJW49_03370 [Clostridia bacterium]|nr:hypothetical protein [Clostridia bacterium]